MGTDGVDWAALTHAHGSAEDVPGLLRAMESEDADARERAMDALDSALCRHGDVYAATAPAVPHLARLALHGPGHRVELLRLLADIADGYGRPDERNAARRAVAVALPSLLSFAHDADTRVRDTMLLLIAACGRPYALPLLPLLRARLDAEPDPAVRSRAVTALALLGAGDGHWRHGLLGDPEPRVRLAAAEDLLRTCEPPLPGALVDVCARAYAADPHPRERGYWPLPHLPFTERLLEDPEAALRALATGVPRTGRPRDPDDEVAWVTLAHGITDHWRGREADVLPWALRAMRGDPWEVNWLAQMACALPPRQRARVRDHVLPHLASEVPDTRATAVTALARARVPQAVAETVRLVEEQPGAYVTVRAVTAVAEVFGADARAAARAVVRRLADAHSELVRVLARFPEVAVDVVDELAALLTRQGTGYPPVAVEVLGRLGPAAGAVGERALRTCVVEGVHSSVSAVAAVAHCRVGGDPGLALSHLRRELSDGPSAWSAHLAGELGPAAVPLLPFIEPYLAPDAGLGARAEAAQAVWRITGRTEDTLEPVALRALAWEKVYPGRRHPVETLTEMGLLPRFAVAPLRSAAESPRRIIHDGLSLGDDPHPDYVVRDAVRELLATAQIVETAG
ncbi:hypothetical protein ABZ078_05275 [Streptomyces sp. NPDC006385]|uniref:hypothetical protein n=1 Tax=Streptomyces sp. NPDC006385 TaxID=3156761 RepID=UPI0033BBB81F